MKAFKRSGARWCARSKPELIEAWCQAPIVEQLIAHSVEHCELRDEGDVLRAKTIYFTIATTRYWVMGPQLVTPPLSWDELRGSPAERYRAGLLELVEARRDDPTKNERDPAARDEEDRRCAALNDLWWRMSPAEQDAFEAWWQERLRFNTPGGLRRFERWLGVTYG